VYEDEIELTLAETVEALQTVLVARATGLSYDDRWYKQLRRVLVQNDAIAPVLPSFVRVCRDLSQFRGHISKVGGYVERRRYIWEGLRAAHDVAEGRTPANTGRQLSDVLATLSLDEVDHVWRRGLERLPRDPAGAITAARSLLESTCKHILDAEGIEYDDALELPKLYRLTASALKLAPDQSGEQLFKQVLGACHTVVEGVAAIRNKFGDAHGKGAGAITPSDRHARLALNLAGSAAMFLVETWKCSEAAT